MTVKSKLLLATAFVLTSCKSYDITPGSERVRVFDSEPKGCLYVGEISSVQEEKTVGTLDSEMDLATRIDLRNKAHALGGNILVFMKGKPGSSGAAKTSAIKAPGDGQGSGSGDSSAQKDVLVFLATVFKCPSSILNQ